MGTWNASDSHMRDMSCDSRYTTRPLDLEERVMQLRKEKQDSDLLVSRKGRVAPCDNDILCQKGRKAKTNELRRSYSNIQREKTDKNCGKKKKDAYYIDVDEKRRNDNDDCEWNDTVVYYKEELSNQEGHMFMILD